VLEVIVRDRKHVRTAGHGSPGELAARLEARIDLLAGARILRASVDLAHRFDLLRGKAIWRIGAVLAGEDLGIEAAAGRIFDEAVLDAVARVASLESGLVERPEFGWRHSRLRIFERGVGAPDEADHEVGPVVGGRSGDDTVVIVGESLRFHESLLAAGG